LAEPAWIRTRTAFRL